MTTPARKSKASLESSMRKLSISAASAKQPTKPSVADSWDEGTSPSSAGSTTPSRPSTPPYEYETPGPPPPTPSSPSHSRKKSTDWASFTSTYKDSDVSSTYAQLARQEKRPDKSSAAAGRMISGALGIKAPKKTEEGKAYEQAMQEKEKKRRARAKEEDARAEKEREEARRAVWDD